MGALELCVSHAISMYYNVSAAYVSVILLRVLLPDMLVTACIL